MPTITPVFHKAWQRWSFDRYGASSCAPCCSASGALLNLLAIRVLLNFNSTDHLVENRGADADRDRVDRRQFALDVWAAAPDSYRFSDIFTALPAAGIVFSYLGFRTAIDLGGESSNPSRHIPLAVIGVGAALGGDLYLAAGRVPDGAASDRSGAGWTLELHGQAGPFAGLLPRSASAGWRRCSISTPIFAG